MDEKFMQAAIKAARQGIKDGQTPFGACIERDGEIVSCRHNIVWASKDITAHAEIDSIRAACSRLDSIDLSGSVIYSTCEPCPMCFSAIHWARIDKIVYGAEIPDALAAGFNELSVSNERLKVMGESSVEIVGGFMRDECVKLFAEWLDQGKAKTY